MQTILFYLCGLSVGMSIFQLVRAYFERRRKAEAMRAVNVIQEAEPKSAERFTQECSVRKEMNQIVMDAIEHEVVTELAAAKTLFHRKHEYDATSGSWKLKR